jgi:hypothetical protein
LTNGDVYEGDFVDNKYKGKGKYTSREGCFVYEGDFVEGNQHGKGIRTYPDGKIFVGEYKDGNRIKGKMTYPNGKVEEGNWDNDKFLGKY